jgi:hypothetical protein
MKRTWPEELAYIFDDAEEVTISVTTPIEAGSADTSVGHRNALKVHVSQQDFQKICPHAEVRYRLGGRWSGKAVTMIANNPHYHDWHPADGGTASETSTSGRQYTTNYIDVYFLLDAVSEAVSA